MEKTLDLQVVYSLAHLFKEVFDEANDTENLIECHLCSEQTEIVKACQMRKCAGEACESCLEKWYSQTQPGHVVFPALCSCPFCKCRVSHSVLQEYNPNVIPIVDDIFQSHKETYYARCMRCREVKPFEPHSCREDVPVIADFICETCSPLGEVKECPNCESRYTHVGGCHHMKCQRCMTDFCHECHKITAGHDRHYTGSGSCNCIYDSDDYPSDDYPSDEDSSSDSDYYDYY